MAAAIFDIAIGAPLLVLANGLGVRGPATTSELGQTASLGGIIDGAIMTNLDLGVIFLDHPHEYTDGCG